MQSFSTPVIADAAVPAPAPTSVPRRFTSIFRNRVAIPLALGFLPLLVYGNTIFHRYGLRDDYAAISEAREAPDRLLSFFGSQGRPLYGRLLEVTAGWTPAIGDICWLRAAAAVSLGVLAAGFFAVLRQQQWSSGMAALTAAWWVLLPSAQVIVGWGSSWPHVVGAWLGLIGFVAAERAEGSGVIWRRGVVLVVATTCVVAGAMVYQPSALFYLTGVAAGVGRRLATPRRQVSWLAWHAVIIGLGLLVAYVLTIHFFAVGIYPRSPRVTIDPNLPGKLFWYFREPLPNALALFALNDVHGHTILLHRGALLTVSALLIGGVVWVRRHHGIAPALLWLACLVGLPLAAYGVSVLAAERWASYRTLYPCAAVVGVLVMTTAGWWWRTQRQHRRVALAGLAAATFVAMAAARWQAFHWIALPQALELRLLEEGAQSIDPAKHPRVFVLTPTLQHAPASLLWRDEFGSLSMDSDWTPKEALKLIMRERFPGMPDVSGRYTYASGPFLPANAQPDVIINLQRIAEYRGKLD